MIPDFTFFVGIHDLTDAECSLIDVLKIMKMNRGIFDNDRFY